MAKATTLKFSELLILVGNGESPEDFAAPCGLTSRGFSRTAETNDTNVPDCDDEDAPAWLERDKVSNAWSASGSGVLAEESFQVWEDWFNEDTARNVRIVAGARIWSGQAHLTQFEIEGERGARVTVTVAITGTGKPELIAS